MAALTVLLTVALAIPRDAWLPPASGLASPTAWEEPLDWALGWLATVQIACGSLLWPADPVAGSIVLPALLGASTAALLARSFRTAGLGPGLATLLALVAASAPVAGWHAGSPLGASPAALVSAIALSSIVGRNGRAASRALSIGLVGLALAIAMAANRHHTPMSLAHVRLITGDLGWPGLLMLLVGFAHGSRPLWPDFVLTGLVSAVALGVGMAGPVGAALALPWAWWLAARGVATLMSWRGPHAGRWAAAGLLIWMALHAGRVPWGHQRQQAALVRTWAEGLAAVPTASQPLTVERSARGLLVSTLIRRTQPTDADVWVTVDAVRRVAGSGRQPIVLGAPNRERLRWSGVALGEPSADMGVGVDRLVEALPRGTIVLAAISRTAAAHLTPAHWQALGRIGLRLADAGSARAHAVVGVTRARVEGQEAAQTVAVRLDVLPGDPIGRTGSRSPVDARLEADDTHVRVWRRDRPLVDARGLVVLFFSTRGDLLAWRTGTSPTRLDGAPLGTGPSTTAVALASLPCVDIAPGGQLDVAAVMREPAIGVTLHAPGGVDVALTRPEGVTAPASALSGVSGPVRFTAAQHGFHVNTDGPATVGIDLRGPVLTATARASASARVCAAWPALTPLDPRAARVDVPMSPDVEPSLAGGWHAIEAAGNGRYFRWMSGPRAGLLLALKSPQPMRFALDAQGVAAPGGSDVVRLFVNGQDAGGRPVLPTRGLYEWNLDPSALRAGLNTLTLETTQTMRPAAHAAGADERLLGLAVHGWALVHGTVDRQP